MPQAQLMPATEDAQLTQLAMQCPASVRYEISLGQGPAAPQVPIFVAVVTLQNNVNVSGSCLACGCCQELLPARAVRLWRQDCHAATLDSCLPCGDDVIALCVHVVVLQASFGRSPAAR